MGFAHGLHINDPRDSILKAAASNVAERNMLSAIYLA